MRTTRILPAALLAATVGVLSPDAAGAQACIGLPLEWSPTAVAVEYVRASGVTQYRARAGRGLGNQFSVAADFTHGQVEPERTPWDYENPITGNGVGATLVYRLVQLEQPICTLASLRYGRSSTDWIQASWDPSQHQWRNEISAIMALTGVGAGREFPISTGAAVIPFAMGQVGWSQYTRRQRCTGECYPYSHTEGLLHLEGELGVLLQLGRIHLAGAYRMTLSEADPLLFGTTFDQDNVSLLAVGVGFVF